MSELRKRARDRRLALGLTQKQAADKAGVTLRTYQGFEAGETRPQEANREKILRALGMAEEDEAVAAQTRSEWPREVEVFLNAMGAYLMTMDEATRMRFIFEHMRTIIDSPDRSQNQEG